MFFSECCAIFTLKYINNVKEAGQKDLTRQYYISVSYPGSGLRNWILMASTGFNGLMRLGFSQSAPKQKVQDMCKISS